MASEGLRARRAYLGPVEAEDGPGLPGETGIEDLGLHSCIPIVLFLSYDPVNTQESFPNTRKPGGVPWALLPAEGGGREPPTTTRTCRSWDHLR